MDVEPFGNDTNETTSDVPIEMTYYSSPTSQTSIAYNTSDWASANRSDFTRYLIGGPTTLVHHSTSSTEGEVDASTLQQYKDGVAILTYAPPFLLVFATIGNMMSVVVLRSPVFRKSSTSFILSALAVVDAVIVNTGLLRQWLDVAFNIDVRNLSSFGCKFHIFIVYSFPMVRVSNLHR
jgi:hypothetical protein